MLSSLGTAVKSQRDPSTNANQIWCLAKERNGAECLEGCSRTAALEAQTANCNVMKSA